MTSGEQESFVTYLIDDDAAVCESLASLFEVRGMMLKSFSSAECFMSALPHIRPGCLLLDEQLPGMSGNQLIVALQEVGFDAPVILISAFADHSMAVSALRRGALNVLAKPIDAAELFDSIDEAQKIEMGRLKERNEFELVCALFDSLNAGELEVMRRIVAGEQNKAIAYDMNVSLRTVELRRHNIFKKLGVDGVADLVKLKLRYAALKEVFAPSAHDLGGLDLAPYQNLFATC